MAGSRSSRNRGRGSSSIRPRPNEFGLPLVRGPFPSLTAAKEAIETTREKDRSRRRWPSGSGRRRRPGRRGRRRRPRWNRQGGRQSRAAGHEPEPESPRPSRAAVAPRPQAAQPAAPALIAKLEALGFDDAEAVRRVRDRGWRAAIVAPRSDGRSSRRRRASDRSIRPSSGRRRCWCRRGRELDVGGPRRSAEPPIEGLDRTRPHREHEEPPRARRSGQAG
jgi:hypothetical protein